MNDRNKIDHNKKAKNLTKYGSRESNPRTTSANFPTKLHKDHNQQHYKRMEKCEKNNKNVRYHLYLEQREK